MKSNIYPYQNKQLFKNTSEETMMTGGPLSGPMMPIKVALADRTIEMPTEDGSSSFLIGNTSGNNILINDKFEE